MRIHRRPEPDEPTRTVLALLESRAGDEEIAAAVAPFADDDRTAERLVIEVLDKNRRDAVPEEVRHRAVVRWYRRAVADGQVWAMVRGGERWDFGGSSDRTGPDEVSADEARGWLATAADLGHRRACSMIARWLPDDERTIGWLRCAYGDGTPDAGADASEYERSEARGRIGADALMLAQLLDEAGDPEAGRWYRSAATCPRWEFSDFHPATWAEAVHGYAVWAHGHVGEDLCAAWAFRLVGHAAEQGPSDRAYMATEYKTYRNDWQMTRGAESARQQVMKHLLEEHDLPGWQRLEIALLLGSCRWFDQLGADLVLDVLHRQKSFALDLTLLLPPGRGTDAEIAHTPITADHAWAAVSWLLADAVPLVFAFAGLADTAVRFGALVPDDIRGTSHWEWTEAAKRFDGWGELFGEDDDGDTYLSVVRDDRIKRFVIDALEAAGLGARPSAFATGGDRYHEEYVDPDFFDTSWRVLRGTPAWLAMYASTTVTGEAEEWTAWWNAAGRFLAYALQGAALRLGREIGLDRARDVGWKDPVRERWRTLGEALHREFTAFIVAAAAL